MFETTHTAYIPQQFTKTRENSDRIFDLQEMCNGVVHLITKETITKYRKLANDFISKDVWQQTMCKESGRVLQGFQYIKGTNTVRF